MPTSNGLDMQTQQSITSSATPYRTILIPARGEHEGLYAINVRLRWICPVCGGPRGEVYQANSFDTNHRKLLVDAWRNPCGHVDTYQECRAEYVKARIAEQAAAGLLGTAYMWESRE